MLHIRLPSVIKALRRRKALILVDTPPVLPVSDARLVAPLADGVLILRRGAGPKPARFQAALDRLALVDTAARHHPQQGRATTSTSAATTATRRRRDRGARLDPALRHRTAPRSRPGPAPKRAAPDEGRPATGGAGLGGRAAARQPRGLPGGGADRHPARLRRRDVALLALAPPASGSCCCSCSCGSRRCCSCSRPSCRGRARWPTRPSRSPWSRSSASCCSGPGCCGRSCAPSRCGLSPALGLGRFLGFAVGALDAARARPRRQRVRRAALRAVHRLLLPRPAAHAHERTCAGSCAWSSSRARWPPRWGLYGFVALDLERAAGPIADPNDFAYLMACALPAGGLPARRGAPPRACCGRSAACCCAARRSPRCRAARWSGSPRSRRGRSSRAAARSAASARRRRDAQRRGARVRALGAAAPDRLERRATSPTRTSPRARRCGGALRMAADRPLTGVGPARFGDRGAGYVRNNPIELRGAGRPQLLSPRAGRDRRCSAARLRRLPRPSWRLLARATTGDRIGDDVDGRHRPRPRCRRR